jgi:hypothetical protein
VLEMGGRLWLAMFPKSAWCSEFQLLPAIVPSVLTSGKYFARVLVTRDRASDAVHILWRPPVPE